MSRTTSLSARTAICTLHVLSAPGAQLTHNNSAPTEIVALENTLNGTIIPQEEVIAISEYAHSVGVKMHLDGARIWHVAAETDTPINELCAPFDSVSLSLSKGLGARTSSLLLHRII